MNSSLKNVISLLVIFVFAFLGYYLFVQDDGLNSSENTVVTNAVLAQTQLFIERSAILKEITIDTSIFENRVFRSYRSFSDEVLPRPIGRDNPFDEFIEDSR